MGRDAAWLRRTSPLGQNTIQRLLTEPTRRPRARTIDSVAELLGVPPAWLTADTPQRQLTPTEDGELLQCVRTLRALARGVRTDVRRKPNVRRMARAAVPQPFRAHGARDVYRVQGASMQGYGLMDGDLVYAKPLHRRAMRAAVGSMIVFALNGALYLRRLTIAPGGVIELRSAHPGYDPMTLRPDDGFEPLGVVVASVRRFDGGS